MLATIDPGTAAPSTATVDPAGVKSTGIRRVAAIMGDELATSFAGAVGGAVGTMTASKLLGPAPSGPPAAAPPTGAQQGGAGAGSGGTGGSAGGAHGLGTSLAAKVAVVVVVGAVAAGGVYAYRHSGDRSQGESGRGTSSVTNSTGLSVQPDRGNFGTVWLGSEASQTYTITNMSTAGVTPGAAAISDRGFTLKQDTCRGKALPAHGACTITVTLRPTQRRSYTGELNVPTAKGGLKLPLTGRGDVADLAGTYSLTRRSIDPPEEPGDYERGPAWRGADGGSRALARGGIELRARSDCGQPRCGYTYHVSDAEKAVKLDQLKDGGFGGRDPGSLGDLTITVRPRRIERGRVMSLVLTLSLVNAGDVKGFTIKIVFNGTRRN
jgi:hypothetical protein